MSRGKVIRRTIVIVVAAVICLAAAGYILIHTSIFTGYVRQKVIQTAQTKLGTRVDIQRIHVPWGQLAVEMRGITVHGRGAPSEPPLLQIGRLKVGIQPGPLFSGKFKLSEVALDRPVVRVQVNRQGQTNFAIGSAPTNAAPAKASNPADSFFNLGIRRLVINQGTIDYSNEKIPLSAELNGVSASVRFNARSDEYYGALAYQSGRIVAKNFAPVETAVNLRFTATRSGITCSPLTITMPGSRLTVYATVQNYSDPQISGTYSANISTGDLARIMGNTAIPAGHISSSGTLEYASVQGQSFLDGLRIDGTLSSPRLEVRLRQFSAPLESLRGVYSLEGGTIRIANLQGQVLGGQMRVPTSEISLSGEFPSRLSASLTNVSLDEVSRALPAAPYEGLSLVGRADLNARISWSGHFQDLVAESQANIYSNRQSQLAAGQIALNGAIRVSYDQARNRASFGNSHLRIGQTAISMQGVLSKNSNLKLTISTASLHEFSELAATIGRAMSARQSAAFKMPEISGAARFDGTVHGAVRNPQLQGRLSARNLEVESTKWRSIEAGIALSKSEAAVSDGVLLVAEKQGRIQLEARAGLRDWSLAPSSPLFAHASAANFQLASLQNLAGEHYPIRGIFSAELSIQGTRQNPSGNGSIRIANGSAWNQPVQSLNVNFHGNATALNAELMATSAAGDLNGSVIYDSASKHYQFEASTTGLELDEIHMLAARSFGIHGTLVAKATGSGTLENPQVAASFEIPQLTIHGQTISNARSEVNVANRRAHFTANAALAGGNLQAQGEVALTGSYETAATLDVGSISVQTLMASYFPQGQGFSEGQLNLHAEARGPLKDPSQFTIRAEIPALALHYQKAEVALVRPLVMDYRDGVATIQKTELKGTGIDLTFQGAIPIKSTAPFNLDANGTVRLSLFQAMMPGVQSSGRIDLAITAHGTLAQPTMQGNLRLQRVALVSASLPVALNRMSGDIRISGNRLEIASLEGDVNGGTMNAQGSVHLGTPTTFDLAVTAKSVDLDYPAGLQTRLDCNLRLNGSPSGSALTGRVAIDYLGFTQQMDVATLASQFSSTGGLSTPSPFEKNMRLNVAVQSSSTLSLASSQLSVQGAANLEITGTLADPVVLGRATLTGGELFFLGKRYEIQNGTIEFANPNRTSASVDLYANTTVNQYKISIHFLGPVDQMKTNFTSTPALPQADIINLLAFGQTTEQAGSNATPGVLGAESVLAQGVASQISGKIQKLAGISQLSITPIIANGQQNPGAQVAIQQRVSGRLLVTFTTNTAQTQSTAVQVQYQLGGGLSISALRDQNGGYGINIHLHKSF